MFPGVLRVTLLVIGFLFSVADRGLADEKSVAQDSAEEKENWGRVGDWRFSVRFETKPDPTGFHEKALVANFSFYNRTGELRKYYLSRGLPLRDFDLVVRDADGTVVPLTWEGRNVSAPATRVSGMHVSVLPKESYVHEILLSSLFELRRGGKYTMSVVRYLTRLTPIDFEGIRERAPKLELNGIQFTYE